MTWRVYSRKSTPGSSAWTSGRTRRGGGAADVTSERDAADTHHSRPAAQSADGTGESPLLRKHTPDTVCDARVRAGIRGGPDRDLQRRPSAATAYPRERHHAD